MTSTAQNTQNFTSRNALFSFQQL